MATQFLLASSTTDVPVHRSAEALDLAAWLFGMSDLEYRQCAKGHFGAGASRLPNGMRTSVNVESVGGHLAVQHYVEEISSRNHVRLVSERSDIWIFHIIHIRPRVTWEMKLIPISDRECRFRHHVSIEHPSVLVKIASVLCFVPLFVRGHDKEEAPLFAASLARSA